MQQGQSCCQAQQVQAQQAQAQQAWVQQSQAKQTQVQTLLALPLHAHALLPQPCESESANCTELQPLLKMAAARVSQMDCL